MPTPTVDDALVARDNEQGFRDHLVTGKQDQASATPVSAPTMPQVKPAGPGQGSTPLSEKMTREELQKEEDEAKAEANDQQAILRRKTEAESAKNMALAAQSEADLNEQTRLLKDDNDRRARAQQEADQADAESKQRAMDLANRKVDPGAFWGRIGTGGSILAALMVGLGQFGAALTHGPNTALDIINDSISRDIDAQKEDIANAKDSARMLDEISKRKYGRAMDQSEFDSRSRLEQLNYAKQKLDAMSQRLSDPVQKANAQQIGVGIQQELTKETNSLARQRIELQREKEAAAARAAAAGANASKEDWKDRVNKAFDLVKSGQAKNMSDAMQMVIGLRDTEAKPGTGKVNARIAVKEADIDTAIGSIDSLIGMVKGTKGSFGSATQRAQADTIAKGARASVKTITGEDPDWIMSPSVMGGGNPLNSDLFGTYVARLEAQKKELVDRKKNLATAASNASTGSPSDDKGDQ
jgi:hypothetical protein